MPRKLKRTPRGFAIYGEYTDSRGNKIRLQESSAAGGPFVWIFTHNADGKEVIEHLGAHHAVSAHLTRRQARWLGRALLRFADRSK